eukprot:573825-Prymnesium_polylepis.1
MACCSSRESRRHGSARADVSGAASPSGAGAGSLRPPGEGESDRVRAMRSGPSNLGLTPVVMRAAKRMIVEAKTSETKRSTVWPSTT